MIKATSFFIFVMLGFSMVACQHNAATSPKMSQQSAEQLLRKDYVSDVDNITHQYFVYLPRGYKEQPAKKWPVILFLHGNGERGDGKYELGYVLSHGPLYEAWIQKKDLPFIIISPQLPMFGMDKKGISYIDNRKPSQIPQRLLDGVPPRGDYMPTPQLMQPAPPVHDMKNVPMLLPSGWELVENDLLQMINNVQREYNTDPARLYLTGLSYGGFGTWYLASKHPQLFAAIAPVVGWGHPDLVAPIAQKNLPVWAFAGGRDTAVDKKFFYAGLNKLEELGAKEVRFTIEEDLGHDTWKRVYAGDDLYRWLLTHSLK
ncbi:MAG: alpha/beta hydrolase [Moraxellaceae bacterium]|nr:MAG: alpha/beta hydrolase [Moraxellaceae bacterium]